MKIIPNPLVASFKGSAGEATAAIWHGTNYLRKKVVPRNPQTTAQTAVRLSMARLVALWKSWQAAPYFTDCRAALTFAALRFNLPAYNTFVKRNRVLEQAASELLLVPPIAWTAPYGGPVGMVTAFTAATGATGEIDLTWTKAHASGFYLLPYVRKAGTNILINPAPGLIIESAEAGSLTGLTAATVYQVYGCLRRSADDRIGESVVDTATTGA